MVVQRRMAGYIHHAEAARVAIADDLAAIRYQIDMIVAPRRRRCRRVQDRHSPGHAQMDKQNVIVIEQDLNELGPAVDP